jgi:hypothetical protein
MSTALELNVSDEASADGIGPASAAAETASSTRICVNFIGPPGIIVIAIGGRHGANRR